MQPLEDLSTRRAPGPPRPVSRPAQYISRQSTQCLVYHCHGYRHRVDMVWPRTRKRSQRQPAESGAAPPTQSAYSTPCSIWPPSPKT